MAKFPRELHVFWKFLSGTGGFSPRQQSLSEGTWGTQIYLLLRNLPPPVHLRYTGGQSPGNPQKLRTT